MTIVNGQITFLINQEDAIIEVHDKDASVTFVRIQMTPNQLSKALSRLTHTECESMEVFDLDKVGKRLEHKELTFFVSTDVYIIGGQPLKKEARRLAKQACPDGWEPDLSFSSRESFYRDWQSNVRARTTIRRWV